MVDFRRMVTCHEKAPTSQREIGARVVCRFLLLGVGEAVGVVALPVPAIAAHVRDVVLSLPAHHALGL